MSSSTPFDPRASGLTPKRMFCPQCSASYAVGESSCTADGAWLLPADDLTGTTVGSDYVVGGPVRADELVTLYLAAHPNMPGARFALLAVHAQHAVSDASWMRFRSKELALRNLKHARATHVRELGRTPDSRPFVVGVYPEGTCLSELLAEGAAGSIRGAVRLGRQLAQAVGAAHRKAIVHHDLRPENVFVTGSLSEPVITVFGFGISVFKEICLKQPEMLPPANTLAYLAPEQARGDVGDHRADIFAIGAILFRFVTGQQPTPAGSARIEERLRELAPTISAPLAAAIGRAMAPDPANRYTFLDKLDAALVPIDEEADEALFDQMFEELDASAQPASSEATEPRQAERVRLVPRASLPRKSLPARPARVEPAVGAPAATPEPGSSAPWSQSAESRVGPLSRALGAIPRARPSEPEPSPGVPAARASEPASVAPDRSSPRRAEQPGLPQAEDTDEAITPSRPPIAPTLADSPLRSAVGSDEPVEPALEQAAPTSSVPPDAPTLASAEQASRTRGRFPLLAVAGVVLGVAIAAGLAFFRSADEPAPPAVRPAPAASLAPPVPSTRPHPTPVAPDPTTAAETADASPLVRQLYESLRAARNDDALDTLGRLSQADPTALDSTEARAAVLGLLQRLSGIGSPRTGEAFDLVARKLGPLGPDLLLELLTTRGGSAAATSAERLLQDPTVSALGSETMRVAYDLRIAQTCEQKLALFHRAGAVGDVRAQAELIRIRECHPTAGCCMRNNPALTVLIDAIGARIGRPPQPPRPTPSGEPKPAATAAPSGQPHPTATSSLPTTAPQPSAPGTLPAHPPPTASALPVAPERPAPPSIPSPPSPPPYYE